MENRSNAVAAAWDGRATEPMPRMGKEWGVGSQALRNLRVGRMPRANLLLEGTAEGIGIVLEMLRLEQREPIVRWHPGQPLELPPPGCAATLVLHDVNELTSDDQHRVLRWLDQGARQVRVVSTTAVPLWPRVQTGAFSDVLYYRLNTVCVDMGI